MRRLQELRLRPEYRSDEHALVRAFFIPCLESSVLYSRAVGYFTSDSLALAARGLHRFIAGNGKMRLVASPVLDEDDHNAILQGYEARSDVIAKALLAQLKLNDLAQFQRQRLGYLAWLVAEERLEIKIALRRDVSARGIYHEKIGVFEDFLGDRVAFSGSSNETAGGLLNNFETLDVYWSWDDPLGRVDLKTANFERLWRNETPGLEVMTFPDAAKEHLLLLRPASVPMSDPELEEQSGSSEADNPPEIASTHEFLSAPPSLSVRSYQADASEKWRENDFAGILEMATGTGKTITALNAISQAFAGAPHVAVVVLVPYQHLVDQWAAEASQFGLRPIKAYGSTASWLPRLKERIGLLNAGVRPVLSIVATHSAGSSEAFTSAIQELRHPCVLIADEVHHLGASTLRSALLEFYGFRLGLSATPARWMDEEGTAFLEAYFRGVIFQFGLQDAIAAGFLTPYEYYPEFVELREDEVEEYAKLTAQIAKAWDSRGDSDELVGHLLRKRADLLNRATGKLDVLEQLIGEPHDVMDTLFYCAPGQIDEVVSLLGRRLGMRVHRFTAGEGAGERESLLQRFSAHELQALVAMRCLDEGVDVPSTQTAYILASSSNPIQFIQRRGRILRKFPGKTKARIFDLITVPYLENLPADQLKVERQILERELRRFSEFADGATNRFTARQKLWPLVDALGLSHLM